MNTPNIDILKTDELKNQGVIAFVHFRSASTGVECCEYLRTMEDYFESVAKAKEKGIVIASFVNCE